MRASSTGISRESRTIDEPFGKSVADGSISGTGSCSEPLLSSKEFLTPADQLALPCTISEVRTQVDSFTNSSHPSLHWFFLRLKTSVCWKIFLSRLGIWSLALYDRWKVHIVWSSKWSCFSRRLIWSLCLPLRLLERYGLNAFYLTVLSTFFSKMEAFTLVEKGKMKMEGSAQQVSHLMHLCTLTKVHLTFWINWSRGFCKDKSHEDWPVVMILVQAPDCTFITLTELPILCSV